MRRDIRFLSIQYSIDLDTENYEKSFDIAFSINWGEGLEENPENINPQFEGLWYTPDFGENRSRTKYEGLTIEGETVEKFRFLFENFLLNQIEEEYSFSGKIPEVVVIATTFA
jgi:hypothetical protein